jgi:hypothetical protein
MKRHFKSEITKKEPELVAGSSYQTIMAQRDL